jgi:dihydrofolate reductase
MRKLVVSVLTSVDGFYEGPGRDLMVLPFDDGFSRHNLDLLRNASTQLFGRRFFDGFHDYWAQVLDDDSQPPVEREIAGINLGIEKVVISDSLQPDPEAPWASSTRIVRREDAVEAVAALKEEGGDDIVLFGSGTTWSPLLDAGLVDELDVLVGPALLGGGSNLYAGSTRAQLRLLEARNLPDSQLVLLRYAAGAA